MLPRKASAVFVVIALFVSLAGLPAFDGWSMGSRVPTVGMQAEDFSLIDLEGKTQSLSHYRGKIVLMNFWATWCKSCTTEMPAMQASFDRLRDKGFVVLAIYELEDDATVRAHSKQHGYTYPVLMIATTKWPISSACLGYPSVSLSTRRVWCRGTSRAGCSPNRGSRSSLIGYSPPATVKTASRQ
ncbi:MAG: Thiol-disulfide oxidoreductase ResA [Nitrospira sp.]|nr:Thiol-disulfide oxidoreductase ResA [Nitrospira sp.]